MSYKDSAYKGGRTTNAELPDEKPRVLCYPCFAAGCPMPGTIFPGIKGDEGKPGSCAWHYGVAPNDIPRVTQTLKDWECVSAEVNAARRVLSGPLASSPAAIEREFAAAWARVEPLAGEWVEQLRPGTIKVRNRVTGDVRDTRLREAYSDWAKRLNVFLGGRVQEALTAGSPRRRAA